MLKKVLGVASAVIGQSELVSAQSRIPTNCIERLGYFGSNGNRRDFGVFDQTQTIAAFLPIENTPESFKVCVDSENDNRLISLSMDFADEDGNDSFSLPIVGVEGGKCETIKNEQRQFPAAIIIYQDGRGINGIRLKPRGENTKILNFGNPSSKQKERKQFNFSSEFDLIGFYGLQNDKAIRTLGLIVKNNQCVDRFVEGSAERGSSFSSAKDDDGKEEADAVLTAVFIIVGAAIIVSILIIVITHQTTKTNTTKVGVVTEFGRREPATANNSEQIPQTTEGNDNKVTGRPLNTDDF